jgi:hypothetical protein
MANNWPKPFFRELDRCSRRGKVRILSAPSMKVCPRQLSANYRATAPARRQTIRRRGFAGADQRRGAELGCRFQETFDYCPFQAFTVDRHLEERTRPSSPVPDARRGAARCFRLYRRLLQSNTAPFIDRICRPDRDGAKSSLNPSTFSREVQTAHRRRGGLGSLIRPTGCFEAIVSTTIRTMLRRWGLTRVLSYIVRPAPAPLRSKVIVLRATSIRAGPDLSYPTRLPSTAEPIARWTQTKRPRGE